MAILASSPVLQLIRRMAEDERTRQTSDRELLEQFCEHGDEGGFASLVRRHGPMVLGVCRAVLSNEADIEDAFQATFLVLARKAGSIRKTESLGCWLHGVAFRTALKAQAEQAKRRKHEAHAPLPIVAPPAEPSWSEVQRALHEELSQLSERHRAPLLLCYLQEKTQDQAAAILGLAKGTLKGRLERARALLRARLVRRGLGPAALLLFSAWPAASASARVPEAMLASSVRAGCAAATGQAAAGIVSANVAMLADGAARVLLIARAAAALTVVLLCAIGIGGGTFFAYCATEAQTPSQAATPGSRSAAAAKERDLTARDSAVAAAQKKQTAKSDSVADTVRRLADQLKLHPWQRLSDEDQLGLFLMDLAKRDVALIASQVDRERAYCGSPSWSYDGRRILFDASPGPNFTKTRLQMLEVSERGPPGLTGIGPGNCPTLSPDGKHLAYLINPGVVPGAKTGIHVMNFNGENRRWLANGGIPRWSPDGRHLLHISFSNPARLALIDVASGASTNLQVPGTPVYSVPSWAGPGLLTAVVQGKDNKLMIALVDVTNPAAPTIKQTLWQRGHGTNVEPIYPVYSPAQKRCVFVGRQNKRQALYAVQPGKAPERLEPDHDDGKIASLALSPDGRYLLFCSDRVWPRPAAGGQPKQEEIIREIRDRGGKVEVDDGAAGKPVIGVVSSGEPDARFDDALLARLALLTKLKKLHLANTKISDAGLKTLQQFKELESLDLAFTPVTDAGLKHLEKVKTLKSVRVSFSGVTAQGVAALQAALPKAKIIAK